ncbi:hypothetical protein B0J14DRAFT_126895 [Halenospora varia]|nr:hypothetical protein B0J14DRAFT_126895 [Halenospora varia]
MYCPMVAEQGPNESKIHRDAMPHVITQWKPGPVIKEKNKGDKRSKLTLRRQRSELTSSSSASLQSDTKSKRWDFGSIRHIRHPSSDAVSPKSAVDLTNPHPIFELSASSIRRPETATPSYVAELEDTSRIALHSKRSMFPGSQLEFQSSAITSRSVIKVIDETIAAIEADNRQLLSRAVSAEQMVKALRLQNYNLQLRLDHCEKNHRRRPRSTHPQSQHSRQPVVATPPSSDTSSPVQSPLQPSPTEDAPKKKFRASFSPSKITRQADAPLIATSTNDVIPESPLLGNAIIEPSPIPSSQTRNSISTTSRSSNSPTSRTSPTGLRKRTSVQNNSSLRTSPTGGLPLLSIPSDSRQNTSQFPPPPTSPPRTSPPQSPPPRSSTRPTSQAPPRPPPPSEGLSLFPSQPPASTTLSVAPPTRASSMHHQISYSTLSGLPKVAPLNISSTQRCAKPLPSAPSPQQERLDAADMEIRKVIEEEKREMDRRFTATIKAIEMEEKTWL